MCGEKEMRKYVDHFILCHKRAQNKAIRATMHDVYVFVTLYVGLVHFWFLTHALLRWCLYDGFFQSIFVKAIVIWRATGRYENLSAKKIVVIEIIIVITSYSFFDLNYQSGGWHHCCMSPSFSLQQYHFCC